MRDSVALTKESLNMFETMLEAGRPVEEIRFIGDSLVAFSMNKQIYDKMTTAPQPARDIA